MTACTDDRPRTGPAVRGWPGIRSARIAGMLAGLALVAGCAGPPAPAADAADATPVLRRAEQAMGAAAVRSVAFQGQGSGSVFGQAYGPGGAWPRLVVQQFARVADYERAAFREDFARSRAEPTGGGATPLMGQGEARGTGLLMGDVAWNLAGTAVQPSPVARDARVHDLWTTPHGVLKAAARWGARLAPRPDGQPGTALGFAIPGRLEAVALLSPAGLVERVDARVPHPVLGDTAVVTRYLDYRDIGGGVQFPGRLRQDQGGHEVLDIAIERVTVNEPSGIELPPAAAGFVERVASEPVAPGVWFLAGGSHNSVLIEMKDHLVLVEAPLYDGRAAAVLAEARRLVPGKPLRTVIASHHHFDHAGGLRAAAAEGATLITSAAARPWFERSFAQPNRIAPDLLARSGRQPRFVGVDQRLTLGDGQRTIEIHEIAASLHASGFLMVHLPAERLLIEADAFTPGAPNPATPARPNDNHVNLVDNIRRLNLAVDRILPLHGRVAPIGELLTLAGRP